MSAYRDDTGRWRFRKWVRLPNGERERISGTPTQNTKRAAETEERAAIDRAIQKALDPHAAKRKEVPTFRAFSEEFMQQYAKVNNKPSEVDSKRFILKNHLVPAFGQARLDEIGQREVERYKSEKLAAKLSPKTINNHLVVLGRALRCAVEWELIEVAPRFKRLREPEPPFDFLTFEEAERLCKAAEGQWKVMIIVALKTGLRIGELIALRWGDVDLGESGQGGQLVVRQSFVKGIVGTPKNNRSRPVPFGETARLALEAHRHGLGEFVFCREDGQMLSYNECLDRLQDACERAELRPVGWHVLRHTFASHLVMRGAQLKAIQELLGHATIEMTLRYAHLSPDARQNAALLLDPTPSPATPPNGQGLAKESSETNEKDDPST